MVTAPDMVRDTIAGMARDVARDVVMADQGREVFSIFYRRSLKGA